MNDANLKTVIISTCLCHQACSKTKCYRIPMFCKDYINQHLLNERKLDDTNLIEGGIFH